MSALLAVLVFGPFVCGICSYLLGRYSKEMRNGFVLLSTAAELGLLLYLSGEGSITLSFPDVCGLGIGFELGGFHTVLAFLAASGWFTASVLSMEYFVHVKRRNRYYMFWLLTLGATMGIFLSADLYTTFIFFEMMSFTSYVFVVQTEERAALRAGGTYLAVAVIGGLVTLSGIFILYHQLGTVQISEMASAAEAVGNKTVLWTGGILTLVGFASKAGAFPLHIWLPTAHPAAPAPASGVLSGVITKTGIYGVSILSVTIFLHNSTWGMMLAVIGGITMILGAVLGVLSIDLKRTLACSSVSQIGFILTGISMQCLLGHHNALAVAGTILHIVNHSLIKMVLFPAAGVIHLSTESFDLNDIRGFGRGKPLLAVIMGVPMLSLAGVPLLSGYVSKTLLHESIVEYIEMAGASAWFFHCLEWVFLISGGLTLCYMLKLFFCIFVEENIAQKDMEKHWKLNRPGAFIAKASAVVLLAYAVCMPLLGAMPTKMMDPIAAFGRGFFHGEVPEHAVEYFSLTNLLGAGISLSIGILVYIFLVCTMLRPWHADQDQLYINPIPAWLDLEFSVYRPLLTVLAEILLLLATVVDRFFARLLFGFVPKCIFFIKRFLMEWWAQVYYLFMRETYIPRPSLEEFGDDEHFAFYANHPTGQKGIMHSFGFGLLIAGIGLGIVLLCILLDII